jgi:hypothetical protein
MYAKLWHSIMAAILTIGILTGILALLYAFSRFDRLVRWQYEHHNDEWQRDGRPAGYFWRAAECTAWSSGIAMQRFSLVWLFKPPAWLKDSSECRLWLKQLRISVLAWNLGIAALLIFFLFFLR